MLNPGEQLAHDVRTIDCVCPGCGAEVTAEIPSLLVKWLGSGIAAVCTVCGTEGIIRVKRDAG